MPTYPAKQREIQEFGAYAFEQLVNGEVPAGARVHIRMGEKVLAMCRIPDDGTQPKSIGKGGYYEIPSPKRVDDLIRTGQPVAIAANTFVNQGPTSAYDPNVPICDPPQDAGIGYSHDSQNNNPSSTNVSVSP